MSEDAKVTLAVAFLAFAAAGIILGWHVAWPIVAFIVAVAVAGS